MRGLVAAVVGLSLVVPAQAAAATPTVSVAGPSTAAPGAAASFTVTVKAGRSAVKKGKLTLLLSTDAKADKKDVKLAAKSFKAIKARKSAKLTLRVTVPAKTAARSYRVLACIGTKCGSRA